MLSGDELTKPSPKMSPESIFSAGFYMRNKNMEFLSIFYVGSSLKTSDTWTGSVVLEAGIKGGDK